MNSALLKKIIDCEKLYLWGAASSGHRAFYKILEFGVSEKKIEFIDKNYSNLRNIMDRPVNSPDILLAMDFTKNLVVITSSMVTEIMASQPLEIKKNLHYSHELLFSRSLKFKFKKDFLSAINELSDILLLDIDEAFTIWNSIEETKNVKGYLVELGVYKGGSIKLMSKAIKSLGNVKKKIIGFDTFEGIPVQTGNGDEKFAGYLSDVSFAEINKTMPPDVLLIKGVFPESTKLADIDLISLAHLDADTYKSTKDGLDWVWPKLSKNGRVILHDYNSQGCPGVKQAVEEFVEGLDLVVIEISESQALLIKT